MANETESNPSNGSFLKIYSIGIVAANKPLDSNEIEVTPMEDTAANSGELTDNTTKYEAKGANSQGGTFSASIDTTASIKAKWFSGTDTNRVTSPDVRRGEKVVIWRFADSDEYHWQTMEQDDSLRRLETVIYSWCNLSKENLKKDADSSYWAEVSTHRKVIRLHTSKNDGEPYVYDIQLDTKAGTLTIQDDIDNYIFLDSKNRRIKMKNADDSLVDLNQKAILIEAPDSVTINTKRYSLNASESNTIKSPTNSTTGQTQLIKATTTNDGTLTVTRMTTMLGGFYAIDNTGETGGGDIGTIIGKVRFRDDVTMEANLHVQGAVTIGSTLDVEGKITTPVDISAPNV